MMFSFEHADGYEARLNHYRHSSTLYSSVGAAFGWRSDRPFAGGDANKDPELRPATAECRQTAPTRPETASASYGSERQSWSFSPTHFRWLAAPRTRPGSAGASSSASDRPPYRSSL